MHGDARLAALSALERCRRDKAWSSATMDKAITEYDLEKRDGALASKLCIGVLQNCRLLDHYIDHFCTTKLEPKVRDILRLGAYQIVFLDKIPLSAAVNESVRLTKKLGYARASGLVNALLRRLAENAGQLPEIDRSDIAHYLGVKYSHPDWIAQRIIGEKGEAFAESFLAANNNEPATCLQINTLKVKSDDYCRALSRVGIEYDRIDYLPDAVLIRNAGSVTALPGFDEGLFYVQDAAARAAVLISGAAAGMTVLDACAAPGGKSFAAAIQMHGEGSITAHDISDKKAQLIAKGAQRLGVDIITASAQDAKEPDERLNASFDLVIADVPCSGLGVIRKKPEIREKTEREIARLPETQSAILDNLSTFVKPGGVLLYSTCTVLRKENEDVIRAFLIKHTEYTAEDFTLGDRIKSVRGSYTFWPNVDGTDGFFVCKLRRNR